MSTLAWLVIGIIVVIVMLKNWDKIMPLIHKIRTGKGNSKQNNESIELTKDDIKNAKNSKLQMLNEEKQKRLQRIDQITFDLRKEIKEIDIEIYLLTQKENEPLKKKW